MSQGDGTLFLHAFLVNPTSSSDEDGTFLSALVLSGIFRTFYVLPDDVIQQNFNPIIEIFPHVTTIKIKVERSRLSSALLSSAVPYFHI
jgi:hypothetical protein